MIQFNQPDNLLQNKAVWDSQMDMFSITFRHVTFCSSSSCLEFPLSLSPTHSNLASVSTLGNFLCFRYSQYISIIHYFFDSSLFQVCDILFIQLYYKLSEAKTYVFYLLCIPDKTILATYYLPRHFQMNKFAHFKSILKNILKM